MRENRTIPELKVRMDLVAKKHKIENQGQWLRILGVRNPSSISRIYSSGKISDDCIAAICAEANITETQFLGPISDLASILGLSSTIVESIVNGKSAATLVSLTSKDIRLLSHISGRYIMLYASRELHDHELEYTTVEELTFDIANMSEGTFAVRQSRNHVTNNSAVGRGKCRSERISFQLSYDDAEYPDSQILINHLVIAEENNIFSGIYVDVNDIQQIFATQIVILQVPVEFVAPRRFLDNSELHSIWKPILENRVGDRHRLIARGGEDYLDKVRAAVKQTKSG